jgi:ABC-type branched-subunit amino acid transport system ATPase component
MTNHFELNIPRTNEGALAFTLESGATLYLLGANGTGKSGLISQLFSDHQATAKRISAHRQTWFQSNSLDMTPHTRENLEQNIRAHDAQQHARYRLDYAAERTGVAIYDLIDSDTMLARKIAEFVRTGDTEGAVKEASAPSPIQVINELLRLSNIPIEISLEERQKIVARKNKGSSFSVAEISDGERNALLIAADILTAKPGTLLLIDEPERHLHRSIISPLLKLLFDKRKDCAFIVSTHELMLPLDTPEATTLLLRGCEFAGKKVTSWTTDLLEPGAPIGEDLKRDLLGARRKIIFVEGTEKSLDAPLYSLLFPDVSIIPKNGCREVEQAVRGLRGAAAMHWISTWGIVDNDQRSPEDVARLRSIGVWALGHYSVESLYYHSAIIKRLSKRQAELLGANLEELVTTAIGNAITATQLQKDHLVTSAVLRSARDGVLTNLPSRSEINTGDSVKIEVDVGTLRAAESARFDELIASANWDGLLARYPLRESAAFDRVVQATRFADQAAYRAAVLKLLQDEEAALSDLRKELGGLYAEVRE